MTSSSCEPRSAPRPEPVRYGFRDATATQAPGSPLGHLSRLLASATLACLVLAPAAAAAREGQGAVGLGEEPESLQLRSEVKGLAIAPAGTIPKAPASAENREFCAHLTETPKSPAARLVAGRGWGVTGQARLPEGRQAVSFAGRFEPGTSGSCLGSEGNVAIFQGDSLLAIAYAPRGARESIGKIVPLGDGNARIWSGDFLSQPMADLRVENGGYLIALAPLAAEEACAAAGPSCRMSTACRSAPRARRSPPRAGRP